MSAAECAFCGRVRRVKDRPAGRARCATCRNRDPSTWQTCTGCGRDRPVNARTDDGGPVCGTCYARDRAPHHTCQQCGSRGPAAVRAGGRGNHPHTLCTRCVSFPERACGGCGRTRRVARRATTDTPDLCPTCYQAPTLTCSRCQQHDLCRATGPDRSAVCFRCQLTEHLDELLAPATPTVGARLTPVREAILAVDNPRTALGWLARSPAAALLARITRGEIPLDHTSLDATIDHASGQWSVEHLRQLLVAAHALPDRDERLTRLRALTVRLAQQLTDPGHRAAFRGYTTWHVLRKVRSRHPDRPVPPAVAHGARSAITAAFRLLNALENGNQQLTELTSPQLQDWMHTAPGARSVRAFLSWARRHHHTAAVPPATTDNQLPRDFTDEEHRWQITRRLLHDDTIAVPDRVAGLLVLLYGQHATRITQLTVADIHLAPNREIRIRLGHDDLLIAQPLAGLITQLPTEQPQGIARALHDRQWLFPGRRPGLPQHPATVMRRLAALEIPLRLTRNSALLHLARELPPVVMADLLGIRITTATRWTEAAAGRWTRYAAHRADNKGRHSDASNIS